jgi:hypothetical protein
MRSEEGRFEGETNERGVARQRKRQPLEKSMIDFSPLSSDNNYFSLLIKS